MGGERPSTQPDRMPRYMYHGRRTWGTIRMDGKARERQRMDGNDGGNSKVNPLPHGRPRTLAAVVIRTTGERGVYHGPMLRGRARACVARVKTIGTGGGRKAWRYVRHEDLIVPMLPESLRKKRRLAGM